MFKASKPHKGENDKMQEMKGYMQGVSSLDSPLSDDSSLALSDTLQAGFSLENDTIDKYYAEHSKNELWGIVERYTEAKENDIIKEIFLHNKTMAQVSREQGLPFEFVRQTKEKGLRKLRTGKAKRELLEKHDSSIVEYLAIQRAEAEERYERHLREIGGMQRKRLRNR